MKLFIKGVVGFVTLVLALCENQKGKLTTPGAGAASLCLALQDERRAKSKTCQHEAENSDWSHGKGFLKISKVVIINTPNENCF